ncbi:MAG: hypothetical protein SGI86_08125 [Deltaproteobacteria bacterium]|nr:hypothetical protein [Deltaproteobacteria bacterium]
MATSKRKHPRLVLTALCVLGTAGGLAFGLALDLRMGAPLVMLGLGGMTLALTAYAAFRTLEPILNDGSSVVLVTEEPGRKRALERDKQMVLKALKEIELDFQMRKISEVDHRELIARYRSRAMRIIAELEAGDDYRSLIEQELKVRLAAISKAPGDAS